MENLLLDISCLEPLFDEFLARNRANGAQQVVVRDVVEGAFDVGIEHPLLGLVRSSQEVDFLDGIMTASAWSKSITRSLELGFPRRFESVLEHSLKAAINHDRDSKWPQLVVGFGYVDSSRWFGFPGGVVGEIIHHLSPGCWRFNDQLVHARRVFSSIDLCYSSDTHQPVRVTFQHEFLE